MKLVSEIILTVLRIEIAYILLALKLLSMWVALVDV
jgi:hypothetical protein